MAYQNTIVPDRELILMEGIQTVALSHPRTCTCITCQAAEGNHNAITTITTQVDQYLGELWQST